MLNIQHSGYYYYYFQFEKIINNNSGHPVINQLNNYLKCYLFFDVKTTDVKKLVNSVLNFLCLYFNNKQTIKVATNAATNASKYFNNINNEHSINIIENKYLNQTTTNATEFLTTHIDNFTKPNSNLICKILLNLISIKSLGDLVTYHYILVRKMMKEQSLVETQILQQQRQQQDNLYTYFLNPEQIQIPLGSLSSADYSLIQSPLINIIFTGNNDEGNNQLYNRCEMVASVHIESNDLVLPLGNCETNIFRLMGCIINTGCNINNFFGNIIQNIVLNPNFSMNITKNINKTNTLKTIFTKLIADLSNPSSDFTNAIAINTNIRNLFTYDYYKQALASINIIIEKLQRQRQTQPEKTTIITYLRKSIGVKITLEAYIYNYNDKSVHIHRILFRRDQSFLFYL